MPGGGGGGGVVMTPEVCNLSTEDANRDTERGRRKAASDVKFGLQKENKAQHLERSTAFHFL